MVPSRVVRGGLPVASELSSLPLGLMGLLVHVIVSEENIRSMVTTEGNIRHPKPFLGTEPLCVTFIWAFPGNSGHRFVGKASCLW